jgi:tRNA(Ile)-lysidine synthase
LRGERAQADQQFVAELCRALGIECVCGQAETGGPPASGEGLEEAARRARYDFLKRAAEHSGARYVATGHTADDQAETILHHVLRGTGLRGLGGMKRIRPLGPAVTLVRPMLEIRRAAVLEYLAELRQPYCEDETNLDRGFLRNRIRHELLPQLARNYSASIVEAILRLGALAADAQRVIDHVAESLLDRSLVKRDEQTIVLDCRPLRSSDPHLVREVLIAAWCRQDWPQQSMGWTHWTQLSEMALTPEPGDVAPLVFPAAIRAERNGEQLWLTASPSTE